MIYNKEASIIIPFGNKNVHVFEAKSNNLVPITSTFFVERWSKFNSLNKTEIRKGSVEYFFV